MNGNITALIRKNSGGGDKEGNRLGSVSGTLNGSYGYDGNRNLTGDGPRGLTVSYYRELDLPRQYYRNANNKVVYQYDASGVKWKKTTTSEGSPVSKTATLYYGPFVYESGSLSMVLTPEGFYDPNLELYHYYLKDHLGNNRIVYHYNTDNTVTVDQEKEYDPFGVLFDDNDLDKNKYLYAGKELNNEFFENIDFTNRRYDAQLGRFHIPDPIEQSPLKATGCSLYFWAG